MSGTFTCICCEKEIFDEQDYTTLICHAAGQTISHETLAHDKCWDKFKKSFVRGRGTSSRTQTFFCPVGGCHNALQHQHLSVRKKTHGGSSAGPTAPKKVDGLASGSGEVPDSYTDLPGLDGAPRLPAKQGEGQPQLSWPSATLPSSCLPRAQHRSLAAPRLVRSCCPHQLTGHHCDAPPSCTVGSAGRVGKDDEEEPEVRCRPLGRRPGAAHPQGGPPFSGRLPDRHTATAARRRWRIIGA